MRSTSKEAPAGDHAAAAVDHDHEADGAAKALMKGGDAVLGTHTAAGQDRDPRP
jgi:hypothetical protein